jgi:glutaminyl-tRNA synthetase
MATTESTVSIDFIRSIITDDQRTSKFDGRVVTRFPPEPNGYLHIGHAKSICLNFGVAAEFGGVCHLRFDDTNPTREDVEFVDSIMEDVAWLGYDWGEHLHYASDYFDSLYQFAVELIKLDRAYVDSLTADEIRQYRGTLTAPGKDSPYRGRSREENLDLFGRMRAGEFEDGSHVLRAKIDMASPNLNLRDPTLYRIRKVDHQRTGDKWPIYPMYDFAHSLSDSIEKITHSLCTLEFEGHRPLYDWFLDTLNQYHSQQIEFARLKLSHTVLSKRKLRKLVEGGYVKGWNDPRMPTISGLRRRGYTPQAIRSFCDQIGIARRDSLTELAMLEHCLREDLNQRAPRVMAVLNPIKVVLTNYPDLLVEEFVAVNNPEDPGMGTRQVPFSRELYIERDDFLEDPPNRFFRLAPGREVRLRYAYYITCVDIIRDQASGDILELRCTYDPESRGGSSPDQRRVRGTLHWVSASHSVAAEVRLYDHLFLNADPDDDGDGADFTEKLDPDSLTILTNCRVEPGLLEAAPGRIFQFERQGYFCVDSVDSNPERMVFNRAVALRDSWAKIARNQTAIQE